MDALPWDYSSRESPSNGRETRWLVPPIEWKPQGRDDVALLTQLHEKANFLPSERTRHLMGSSRPGEKCSLIPRTRLAVWGCVLVTELMAMNSRTPDPVPLQERIQ